MKKLLLMAAGLLTMAAASAADYYVIGENVNGKKWALAAEDCKFKETSTAGVYEWTGIVLGSGFKINDGTWSNPQSNFGSNGSKLILDVPYSYGIGGSTGNIPIRDKDGKDVAEVENPKIVLNTNSNTITVSGQGGGEVSWYIMGVNGNWDWLDQYKFTETGAGTNIFSLKGLDITATGEFKMSTSNWAEEWGTNGDVKVTETQLTNVLEEVMGEAGNIPYTVTGKFDIEWDYNTKTLKFTRAGDAPEAVYYLIGAGVNGKEWLLADPAAKFELTQTGIYTLSFTSLLSSFKINDGTWTNPQANIGASEQGALQLNTAYKYGTGEISGNITFADDITEVKDGVVTLNTNDMTLTIVGTPVRSEKVWYVAGINEATPTIRPDWQMAKTATDGVFELKGKGIQGEGSFKIATDRFSEQYGFIEETTQPVTDTNLTTTLGAVSIDAAVPYTLDGTYDITWNYASKTVTFVRTGDYVGITGIESDNDAPVRYFNLQGVELAEPAEGLCIRVQGSKAQKLIIRK